MEDMPLPSPAGATVDPSLEGDAAGRSPAERSVIVGLDGNASSVLKRIPKALAVENDDWVDFLDVKGGSDAWFDGDGDVVCYGT